MLPQDTRESAIRREAFTKLSGPGSTIHSMIVSAILASHAGVAWFWVRHGGDHFYLNPDSGRTGVRQYLRIVMANAGDAGWSMRKSMPVIRDQVAVGPRGELIDGFEFYRQVPSR